MQTSVTFFLGHHSWHFLAADLMKAEVLGFPKEAEMVFLLPFPGVRFLFNVL